MYIHSIPQTSIRPFRAMQVKITIQTATLQDLPGLVHLFDGYRQFYRKSSDLEGAHRFLSERFQHQDSVIFVAKTDDLLVGFVQLYPSFSSVRMSPIWILNDLYVQPDRRGQGIGKRLMEEAGRHAAYTGYSVIELATENTNTHAQQLYEKLGYSKITDWTYYALNLG